VVTRCVVQAGRVEAADFARHDWQYDPTADGVARCARI